MVPVGRLRNLNAGSTSPLETTAGVGPGAQTAKSSRGTFSRKLWGLLGVPCSLQRSGGSSWGQPHPKVELGTTQP